MQCLRSMAQEYIFYEDFVLEKLVQYNVNYQKGPKKKQIHNAMNKKVKCHKMDMKYLIYKQ